MEHRPPDPRGLERTKQVEAFYNFSLGSSEGLCAGSSGAFDNATCDASGTVHARKRAAPGDASAECAAQRCRCTTRSCGDEPASGGGRVKKVGRKAFPRSYRLGSYTRDL